MMVCAVESGSVSDPILVSNDTRQGCVLAPKFFSLIFATTLFSALPAADSDLTARNRCNGCFFNVWRSLKPLCSTSFLQAIVPLQP